MTSVCGILIAAQQLSLLTLIGELPPEAQAPAPRDIRRHLNLLLKKQQSEPGDGARESWRLSWNSIFTWQCPMMFIGYSFLFYFVGLTVVVCTPLINREEWGPSIYVCTILAVADPFCEKAVLTNFPRLLSRIWQCLACRGDCLRTVHLEATVQCRSMKRKMVRMKMLSLSLRQVLREAKSPHSSRYDI